MNAPTARTVYDFDDRNIRWAKLGEFEHFVAWVYDVDRQRRIVDFILKFDPDSQIVLHRHLALSNTLVVQGEHRLYEPTGELKEVRPVGSYTSSFPTEPHREGGGAEGAVVFYSIRAEGEGLFELFDDDGKSLGILGIADFAAVLEQQKAAA